MNELVFFRPFRWIDERNAVVFGIGFLTDLKITKHF